MNNRMWRLSVISALSLLSFCLSASSLNVKLINGESRLDLNFEVHQMNTWQATARGDCTYSSKVTENYSDRDKTFVSGYLLQARLNCVHGEHNSDYYLLPELFLGKNGKAAVSLGGDDSVTFHYEVSLS